MSRVIFGALQRLNIWIKSALITEWMRLMKVHASTQGRIVDEARLVAAMV